MSKNMFPSQMVILMAIARAGAFGGRLPARSMDVAGEYIGCLYDSLVKRDYIMGNVLTGYRLTSKGRDTLTQFLRENETKSGDTIKTLQMLGIEIGQETDQLVREATGQIRMSSGAKKASAT